MKKFKENLLYYSIILFSVLLTLGTSLLLNPTIRKSILSNAKTFNALNNDGKPVRSKTLKSNGDGTYTLSLNVTGDSIKKHKNSVNVIVVLDTSTSMEYDWSGDNDNRIPITEQSTYYRLPANNEANADVMYGVVNNEFVQLTRNGNNNYSYNGERYTGQRYIAVTGNQRIHSAKRAVQDLAVALLSKNTEEDPKLVEMALIDFSRYASKQLDPTTDLDTYLGKVGGLSLAKGTNWEAALRAINDIHFDDDDQTFIVFVTDGDPTYNMAPNNDGYTSGDTSGTGNGPGFDNNGNPPGYQNSENCYVASKDEAATLMSGNNKVLYTIGAYGIIERLERLTNYAYNGDENEKPIIDNENYATLEYCENYIKTRYPSYASKLSCEYENKNGTTEYTITKNSIVYHDKAFIKIS